MLNQGKSWTSAGPMFFRGQRVSFTSVPVRIQAQAERFQQLRAVTLALLPLRPREEPGAGRLRQPDPPARGGSGRGRLHGAGGTHRRADGRRLGQPLASDVGAPTY
ncbi:hypothetical protein [Cystobacter fuscus]|uniref:hypothetical protein n=1 Tax=Cystobacter fuscus TaxID=43 RepID=UPI0018DF50AC|nr:hypothetical protein [Cystobacter fuscus]